MSCWVSWSVIPCPTNMLGLVVCGTVSHKHVGSRGLWHPVPQTSCWVSWAVAPCPTNFMLGLVVCGTVSHKLHVGSRGLWHRAAQTSCWVSWSVAPCTTNVMLGLVGCGTVPHKLHFGLVVCGTVSHKRHVGSRGLWHRAAQTSCWVSWSVAPYHTDFVSTCPTNVIRKLKDLVTYITFSDHAEPELWRNNK